MNYKQKVRKMWCNWITKSHGSIVPSHLWRERLGQYCINFPNNLGLDLQIHTFPYKAEIVLLALWQNTMQLPNGLLLLATIFYLHLPLNLQRKINNGFQSCKVKYIKKKKECKQSWFIIHTKCNSRVQLAQWMHLLFLCSSPTKVS